MARNKFRENVCRMQRRMQELSFAEKGVRGVGQRCCPTHRSLPYKYRASTPGRIATFSCILTSILLYCTAHLVCLKKTSLIGVDCGTRNTHRSQASHTVFKVLKRLSKFLNFRGSECQTKYYSTSCDIFHKIMVYPGCNSKPLPSQDLFNAP